MDALNPHELGPDLNVTSWPGGQPIPRAVLRLSVNEARPLVLAVDRNESCSTVVSQLLSCLSIDEMRRYSAFQRSSDAELYFLGRGLLRILLAALSKSPHNQIRIKSGPHGKPFRPNCPEFNISYSGDLVLIAIHPTLALGVDVEALPPPPDWENIAARVLPNEVCLAIQELPRNHQPSAFLQAWCHLEARLKMTGTGFQIKQSSGKEPTDFNQWRLLLPHGYVGSVAMSEA